MAKKEEAMVWQDKSGKYKMGYSQYLQQQQLLTERMLLIAVVILIVMMILAFVYAEQLIGRIDALNVIGKMFTTGFCLQ
jgi:hypothetical protein